MTSPTLWAAPIDQGTARDVVASQLSQEVHALRRVVGRGANGSSFERAIIDRTSSSLRGLADRSIDDALIQGFHLMEELLRAARATRDTPGSSEVVPLAEQDFTATETAAIDVNLGPARIFSIPVRLELILNVTHLLAHVEAGALVGLTTGDGKVTVVVTVGEVELPKRQVDVALPAWVIAHGRIELLPVKLP